MKLLTVCLAACVLLFAACKKGDDITNNTYNNTTVAPPAQKDLIPLATGNTWNWRAVVYHVGTNDTITYATTVIDFTVINGDLWAEVTDGVVIQDQANREGGFYETWPGEIHLDYKYPAILNDRVVNGTDTVDVTSVDAAVTVPAGSFTCNVYNNHNSGTYANINYITPGVGVIKQEIYNSGALYSTIELMSYTLH